MGLWVFLILVVIVEAAAGLVVPLLVLWWVNKQVGRIGALEREVAFLRGQLKLPSASDASGPGAGRVWELGAATRPTTPRVRPGA